MRGILAVLRCGPNSIHQSWINNVTSMVDVVACTFGSPNYDLSNLKLVHHFDGSKMGGIKAFFSSHPHLLREYSHIWLIEDDLFIPSSTVRIISRVASSGVFPIFQPALSWDSYHSFASTIQNPRFEIRIVDFVEQMSPVFSSALFAKALGHFDENYYGSGFEWLWQKLIEEDGAFGAIVDAAPISHTRRVGTGDLRAGAGSQSRSEEMRAFMDRHKLKMRTLSYAGIIRPSALSRKHNKCVVSGSDFVEQQIRGLRDLLTLNPELYAKLAGAAASNVAHSQILIPSPFKRAAAACSVATQYLSVMKDL